MLGGGPRQWPDNIARRYYRLRPFVEKFLKRERLEERYRTGRRSRIGSSGRASSNRIALYLVLPSTIN
jgi:hypothetical protein